MEHFPPFGEHKSPGCMARTPSDNPRPRKGRPEASADDSRQNLDPTALKVAKPRTRESPPDTSLPRAGTPDRCPYPRTTYRTPEKPGVHPTNTPDRCPYPRTTYRTHGARCVTANNGHPVGLRPRRASRHGTHGTDASAAAAGSVTAPVCVRARTGRSPTG
jgi:hypothetical protein